MNEYQKTLELDSIGIAVGDHISHLAHNQSDNEHGQVMNSDREQVPFFSKEIKWNFGSLKFVVACSDEINQ